jgi:YidC/Oxa1 family membrane protein insertase
MEKRAVLAAVLMAGLLILYQFLFVKPPAQTPAPQEKKQEQAPPPGQTNAEAVAVAGAVTIPPKEAPPVPQQKAGVVTPLYRAVISSDGGRFDTWDLIYRGTKPMIVPGELGPLGLTVAEGANPPRRIQMAISPRALNLTQGAGQGEMTLVGEDGFGLRVTEVVRFHADSYVVEHDITVENRHQMTRSAEIGLTWAAPVQWPKEPPQTFQGQHPVRVVKVVGGSARREDLAKLVDSRGAGQWVGLESEWYLSALIPKSGGFQLVEAKRSETRPANDKPVESVDIGVRAVITSLAPGATWEGRVLTYTGPKEYGRLRAVGYDLDKSIYFGGFPIPQAYGGLPMEWLAVPILWVMDHIYAYIGNYGVAIILLTVMTKVLFFPLTIKSMTSMKAMQALQPQVNAIRSKYKSDPQRLQKETMELYRENKVNPLGGCLPMIVQIPIFYALYVALSVSVELQNQPFICFGHIFGLDVWICDLAAHDPTYILPLIMGASMFIQQRMTPVMGDPRQAKMMLFMPIVFTFMFLNLPSGLVLYWTLSNVFQIAQQKYIEHMSRKPEVGKLEKGPRVPKKA